MNDAAVEGKLIEQLTDAQRPEDPAACQRIEQALVSRIAAARQVWKVAVSDAQFVSYLSVRLDAERPVEEAISEMHTADLLIACASAAGESQAIIALESTFFSRLEKLFRRPRFPAALADDVLQTLREQLFVGSEQTPPRIEGYRGQGPLSRWLQVVAVRTAARLIGKAEKEIPVAEHRPETLTSQQEPLVEALKRKYRQQFKRAFEKALADLTPRQRTLLRQHHIDGLTLDELAMAYRVHRATIARWLARAREQLAVETQQTVSAQLAEEGTDLLSISRLVDSQLLPTLNSVLQAGLD